MGKRQTLNRALALAVISIAGFLLGAGGYVLDIAAGILSIDVVQANTTNGDLTIQPNGSGTNVLVLAGKTLKADTITSYAGYLSLNSAADILLNPTDGDVKIDASDLLNVTLITGNTGQIVIRETGGVRFADDANTTATQSDFTPTTNTLTLAINGAGSFVLDSTDTFKTNTIATASDANISISAGATDRSILLNPTGSGGVTVAAGKPLTADRLVGLTGSYNGSNLANRNLVINGDPVVAQRGTSFAAAGNATYTLDRWMWNFVGATAVTITQNSDVPTFAEAGRRIPASLKIDVTTADASLVAGDVAFLSQRIEGYRWSQADQRPTVCSFWVKSPKTGTHCISLRNSGLDRSLVGTYSVSVADTWEFKEVALIASVTSGTWNYTTGVGAHLSFALMAGTAFHASAAGAWENGNFVSTSAQVNCVDNAANNFFITGVQLEVGTVATSFQTIPFAEEQDMCLRYYERWDATTRAYIGSGHAANTTLGWIMCKYEKRKRVAPTFTASGTASHFTIQHGGGSAGCSVVPTVVSSSNDLDAVGLQFTLASGLTVGQGLEGIVTSTAVLEFDAEL